MMQLSFEQLTAFALGLDALDQRDGGVRASRMPRPLRPVYGDTEFRRVRMACTTGVRFRFRSDTRCVRLAWRLGASARPWCRGVLVLDHATQRPVGPAKPCERWEGSVELAGCGDGATRTIDLWLPHLAACDLAYLAVDDGASVAPAPRPALRWLAYGDSITQGMEATLPTRTWVGRCALALDANALNVGVGGAVLERGLAVDPGVNADLITISFGVNDFAKNVPPGDVLDNGRQLLAVLRSRSRSPVVMFTPLPWRGRERNDAGHHQEAYRDALRSLAGFQNGVTVVEGPDLVPSDPRYLPDAVHPNDEGFEVMADRVMPILRNAMLTTNS